ncbi:MAG: HNH endonuclease [Proteobacteria bacterium]|nr:HNH endonuclease [Pseudomonadota bacterium]
MSSYLFAWNPNRWPWNDLDAQIEQIGIAGSADDRWSSGNTKQLPAGSRFYLIRLGAEPKGIIGSGITITAPSYGTHWDEAKTLAGEEALYCDIRFDFLSSDVIVTWGELQEPPFSSFRWGIQASGIALPESIGDALERLWQSRAGTPSGVTTSFVGTLPEGAKRTVTINAYERNPRARAACIAYHGHICKVCGVDLGAKFGTIASGFIHVHHVVPISSIGRSYHIDPIRDLVPVCPTCHAILHLRRPPLSIEEASALLQRNG